MIKALAAAAFVGLFATAEIAAAQQVSMPVRVRAGDAYTVTVLDRNSTTSPEGDQGLETTSVWALDVLSTAQPNARWRWTPVSFTINSFTGPQSDPAMQMFSSVDLAALSDAISALFRVTADIGFECRVDRSGRCIELSNWPVWKARAENTVLLVDAIARVALAATGGEPSAEAIKEAYANGAPAPGRGPSENLAMYNTYREPVMRALAALLDGIDARAAAWVMSGVHPMNAVQGRTLVVGQETPFTEEWAMPFGAPPIRVTGTMTLTGYDVASGTATIVRRSNLDSDSLKIALRMSIAYIMEHLVVELNEVLGQGTIAANTESFRAMADMVLAMFTVTFQEETRGTVDLRTGLARETVTDYRWGLISAGAPAFMPPSVSSEDDQATEGEEAAPDAPAEAAPAPSTGPNEMVSASGTMTIRVTRGAPAQPRLPRGQRNG